MHNVQFLKICSVFQPLGHVKKSDGDISICFLTMTPKIQTHAKWSCGYQISLSSNRFVLFIDFFFSFFFVYHFSAQQRSSQMNKKAAGNQVSTSQNEQMLRPACITQPGQMFAASLKHYLCRNSRCRSIIGHCITQSLLFYEILIIENSGGCCFVKCSLKVRNNQSLVEKGASFATGKHEERSN